MFSVGIMEDAPAEKDQGYLVYEGLSPFLHSDRADKTLLTSTPTKNSKV